MPAYRFSWNAFDDSTVRALAEEVGFEGPRDAARVWLEGRVKRPTPEFVGEVKDALVRTWLPQYPGAEQIVDRLIDAGVGPLGNPRSQQGYVKYIEACRNSKRIREYLLEAMLRFGDADHVGTAGDDDPTHSPRFAILSVQQQQSHSDSRKPHDYQKQAWDRLSAHLAESRTSGVFQGLLVMPTGSGKTFTAVRWLMTNILAAGRRVLWLAHRQELLGHAAAEFHRLAGLAKPKERLRVRIVSGAHCSTSQIDPADDVVVASVLSLAKRPDIAQQILSDDRLFVVIDEAHHAAAKSYRDIIQTLQERKRPWSILGLTATPTRTIEDEKPLLTRLFGNRVIAQVELGELVEKGILARPIPVVVKTGSEVEADITEGDRNHLAKFHELSEDWLDRIAKMSSRNSIVIKHYLENRTKYGPTLIFAINVTHAALLADDLTRLGVRADYVASYRPDGTVRDALSVISQFRQGKLDVLVNVQMVTEGVDVPSVQTVFLTRPTNSEIAMRQMIGRALRGPAAGGSDKAYLVSFEDHWDRFREWDSPFSLVPDIRALAIKPPEPDDAEPTTERTPDLPDRFYEHLPWETIRSVAAVLGNSIELKADAFEAVPQGWLVLERAVGDEFVSIPIPTYEHQTVCWNALLDYLTAAAPEIREATTPDDLFEEFFDDCDLPSPSRFQVEQVLEHFRTGGERPGFHDVAGRSACDPYKIAEKIHKGDLGRRETSQLIEASYTALAKAIYATLRDFDAAVVDALFEIDHPEAATRAHRAVPVFDPRPDQQLSPGPTHDLQALMAEVLEEGAKVLGVPRLEYDGTLGWSKRILKGWLGMAYYQETPKRIKINVLLDSPDIDAATMKFLLWHEYLHVFLSQGHTKTFRELERKWPGMVDADRRLDNLNEKFGVSYW